MVNIVNIVKIVVNVVLKIVVKIVVKIVDKFVVKIVVKFVVKIVFKIVVNIVVMFVVNETTDYRLQTSDYMGMVEGSGIGILLFDFPNFLGVVLPGKENLNSIFKN